jgi:hypothetical protein
MAKSQLGVKENKVGPRASGLGPHVMRKCPLKRTMSAPVGQRSVGVACWKEGPHVLVEDDSYSWVLENENGQCARGIGSHAASEMVLAKEKGLAGRGRRIIENSRVRTIKNRSAEVPTMNQIGLHAS